MGTSGAYGGSGRQAWEKARHLVGEIPAGAPGTGAEGGPTNDEDQALADLWNAVGDAFAGEDQELVETDLDDEALALDRLLPKVRPLSGSGGRSGGGAAQAGGRREPIGRRGSRSTRSVVGSAARGGAAIGAGYALRQGDAGALADFGLNLDELRGMSPVRQCAAILDTVLGEGSHPDEYALRKASLEVLKEILLSEQPPTEEVALRGFVVNFVFELALVELQKDLDAGVIDSQLAARREQNIRRYLERRVAGLEIPTSGSLPVAEFQRMAARLTKEAIRVIRGAAEAA